MGSRRLPTLADIAHVDAATLKRGARVTARFAHRHVAVPAATFLVESVDGLFTFIEEFSDSVEEVRQAMERARSERHTISAHRR